MRLRDDTDGRPDFSWVPDLLPSRWTPIGQMGVLYRASADVLPYFWHVSGDYVWDFRIAWRRNNDYMWDEEIFRRYPFSKKATKQILYSLTYAFERDGFL